MEANEKNEKERLANRNKRKREKNREKRKLEREGDMLFDMKRKALNQNWKFNRKQFFVWKLKINAIVYLYFYH